MYVNTLIIKPFAEFLEKALRNELLLQFLRSTIHIVTTHPKLDTIKLLVLITYQSIMKRSGSNLSAFSRNFTRG